MVTVVLPNGTQQVNAGADFAVLEGVLFVTDGNGGGVAAFAPGAWQSAEVTIP